MDFNPALLIMNPRRIHRCCQALGELDIDKFWLTAMWERELEKVVDDIVERTDYTHFLMTADDVVPSNDCLERVLTAMRTAGEACVTGYCNNFIGSPHVNLTKTPFRESTSVLRDYDFFTREEVDAMPGSIFRSCFAGMMLTGMSRGLWKRFPFRAVTTTDFRGYCSDWLLSKRLHEAGVPIFAATGAFAEHVREKNRGEGPDLDPEKRLLVTVIPPEVRWQKRPVAGGRDVVAQMRPWTLEPLHRMLSAT